MQLFWTSVIYVILLHHVLSFFSQKVVRPWHRLLREAVGFPSLEMLRARLDEAA